jgi:hypothetical protein
MIPLLCIHFIHSEHSTHKNHAGFARLKVVQLYKTGQWCNVTRFWQFFKLTINFNKQPALWIIIIVLLALSFKISTNNLCNWLISYVFIIQYSDLSSVPLYHYHRSSDLQHTFCLLVVIFNETCLWAKRRTSTLVSYLFQSNIFSDENVLAHLI